MTSTPIAILCSITIGMAALGCAISPESALNRIVPDGKSDDESADEGDDTADDDEAQADDEAEDEADDEAEDDDSELDSTKDAVRVNEPDAGAPRDAGNTAVKDAAQSKPEPDVVVDAATPVKDAAVDAGAIASCTAGTYVGTFSVDIGGGLTRDSTFAGSVTLQLSGTGDNLKIQTGSLSGKDAEGNALTAKVSGSLNCLTKKLEGGTLSDGVFEQRGLISTIRFSGTMTASFSTESSALQGTWTLESSLRTRSGTGRFTAIKQP